MILGLAPPGSPPENIGVVLVDLTSGRPHRRFRRDLEELSPEDADILDLLDEDLALKANELGGPGLLAWLEDNASNYIRVSDPETGHVDDFGNQLKWLYHRHIRPRILQFRTHLPVYSLQAAA